MKRTSISIYGGLLILFVMMFSTSIHSYSQEHNLSTGAHGITANPSSAVFQNNLWVFNQGRGNNKYLEYRVLNEYGDWSLSKRVPNVRLETGPSAVVYNNKLYVFHQDYKKKGDLWYIDL